MSIPAVNMTWAGQGPTDTLQVLAQGDLSGNFASTLIGTATFVLDGTLTAGVVNYIDGTKRLSFNPTGVACFRIGGTGLKSIAPTRCVDDAASGGSQTATVELSAAGTNTQTIGLMFIVLR